MAACSGTQGFHKGTLAPFQTATSYRYLTNVDAMVDMASYEGQEDEAVVAFQKEDQSSTSDAVEMADADDQDDVADGSDNSADVMMVMKSLDRRANLQADTKMGIEVGRGAGQSSKSVDDILKTAFRQVGKHYRTGGTSPYGGFDCSGFTTWVYSQYGIHLPRNSSEQFRTGRVVPRDKLKAGDLVFFKRKHGISHVGIYVDNGTFIHSPGTGGTVKVSNLAEPSWDKYFAGGRRVVQ